MSKQSDAKAAQGYQDKPAPSTCGNCAHFATTRELPKWEQQRNKEDSAAGHRVRYTINMYGIEVRPRCGPGGFAVKKSATCDQFALNVAP